VATAIIAAGSRSNDLLRPLGLDIPLVAERGYHIDLAPSAPAVSRPVALPSFGVVLSPTDHGTRLVGLSHFGRPGFAARPSLLSSALKRLQVQLPQLEPDEHGAIWSGERPATPDSLPVVDRVARFHGLFVCTGHGHTGLTLAAATAGLLADLVCGDTHELHSRLAISRFRRRAPA
jgi:D-amino-acid dehydrogenase